MKKLTVAFFVILILLNACTSSSNPAESTLNKKNESESTAASAEPTQTSKTDQLLADYLAGEEVDTSVLNPADFSEFSRKLAKKLNAERGINPVVYNNEAYISPDNFMMMNYDGHPDQNETITMFHPIEGFDADGNLQISVNGKVTTIENSADMDWGQSGYITDPTDSRIDWPLLEKGKSGYSTVQYPLVHTDYQEILIPVILLDKNLGELFLNGQQPRSQHNLQFYIVETDNNGNPTVLRVVLVMPGPIFRLFEENSRDRFETTGGGIIEDYSSFYTNLKENSTYYLSVAINQDEVYKSYMKVNHDGYQGITFGNDAFSILTNQEIDNTSILALTAINLIKAVN